MNKDVLSNRFDGTLGMSIAQMDENQAKRALTKFIGEFQPFDVTNSGQSFAVTVTNNTTAAQVFCLFPGDLTTKKEILDKTGVSVDAIITDTYFASGISVEGDNLPYWVRQVLRNPTVFPEIQLTVTNDAQIGNPLQVSAINPYGIGGRVSINPRSSQTENNPNAKMVTMRNLDLLLGDATVLTYKVNAGEVVTLNMLVGASRNNMKFIADALAMRRGQA